MHAIQVSEYGDASVLQWGELPDPKPAAGEVAVRVTATGVNFADIMSRRGGYSAGSEPPFIPGLDCAGVVLALGEGVKGIQVGQRVAAYPTKGFIYADRAQDNGPDATDSDDTQAPLPTMTMASADTDSDIRF